MVSLQSHFQIKQLETDHPVFNLQYYVLTIFSSPFLLVFLLPAELEDIICITNITEIDVCNHIRFESVTRIEIK